MGQALTHAWAPADQAASGEQDCERVLAAQEAEQRRQAPATQNQNQNQGQMGANKGDKQFRAAGRLPEAPPEGHQARLAGGPQAGPASACASAGGGRVQATALGARGQQRRPLVCTAALRANAAAPAAAAAAAAAAPPPGRPLQASHAPLLHPSSAVQARTRRPKRRDGQQAPHQRPPLLHQNQQQQQQQLQQPRSEQKNKDAGDDDAQAIQTKTKTILARSKPAQQLHRSPAGALTPGAPKHRLPLDSALGPDSGAGSPSGDQNSSANPLHVQHRTLCCNNNHTNHNHNINTARHATTKTTTNQTLNKLNQLNQQQVNQIEKNQHPNTHTCRLADQSAATVLATAALNPVGGALANRSSTGTRNRRQSSPALVSSQADGAAAAATTMATLNQPMHQLALQIPKSVHSAGPNQQHHQLWPQLQLPPQPSHHKAPLWLYMGAPEPARQVLQAPLANLNPQVHTHLQMPSAITPNLNIVINNSSNNNNNNNNNNIVNQPQPPPPPPPRPWLEPAPKNYNTQSRPSLNNGPSTLNHDQSGEFTVLSYNVLADRLVSSAVFPSSPASALDWPYRRQLIRDQLLHYDADIVALQELEWEQFDTYFKPELRLWGRYEALFEPKSRFKTMDANRRRRVDGCAIFYKSHKFRLVQRHLLEFNQLAMANARGSEAMLNRVMTKDNIALVAVLQLINTSNNNNNNDNHSRTQPQQIIVCNTHIHWDPDHCDVKLIQTIMLMNELQHIARHHGAHLCPDSQPSSNTSPPCTPSSSTLSLSPMYSDLSSSSSISSSSSSSSSPPPLTTSSSSSSSSTSSSPHNHFNLQPQRQAHQGPKRSLMPLVLLGDFNSLPNSGVADYLTGGRISASHQEFQNFKYNNCSNSLAISRLQQQQHNLAGSGAHHQRPASPQSASLSTTNHHIVSSPAGDSSAAFGAPSGQAWSQSSASGKPALAAAKLSARRQSSPAWIYTPSSSSPAAMSPLAATNNHSNQSKLQRNQQQQQQPQQQQQHQLADSSLYPASYAHPFELASAYEADSMPYTNYTTNFKAVIDYIFYSADSIRLLGHLGPLDKRWVKANGFAGFPQRHLPSDHLPLLARLRLMAAAEAAPPAPPAPVSLPRQLPMLTAAIKNSNNSNNNGSRRRSRPSGGSCLCDDCVNGGAAGQWRSPSLSPSYMFEHYDAADDDDVDDLDDLDEQYQPRLAPPVEPLASFVVHRSAPGAANSAAKHQLLSGPGHSQRGAGGSQNQRNRRGRAGAPQAVSRSAAGSASSFYSESSSSSSSSSSVVSSNSLSSLAGREPAQARQHQANQRPQPRRQSGKQHQHHQGASASIPHTPSTGNQASRHHSNPNHNANNNNNNNTSTSTITSQRNHHSHATPAPGGPGGSRTKPSKRRPIKHERDGFYYY